MTAAPSPCSARGREVLARLPGAEVVEVPSHRQIPELDGDEGDDVERADVDRLRVRYAL